MIFRCTLLLFLLGTVKTSANLNSNGLAKGRFDRSVSYAYWPSMLNAAGMMRIRKRELEQVGQNEGGGVKPLPLPTKETPSLSVGSNSIPIVPQKPAQVALPTLPDLTQNVTSSKIQTEKHIEDIPKVNTTAPGNETIIASPVPTTNTTKANLTLTDLSDKVDLSGPGVVKRGVIVFGGFALLAVAYFIFYRRKGSSKDPNNTHNAIDANQFRYGVLQSEDRRDNMELSRVPLTMESDDDEDDDLEIFDLEQKKKSMSYVNLQVNDEELVNGPKDSSKSDERDNLLLDIEDVNTDALINWSNNGNKSIL